MIPQKLLEIKNLTIEFKTENGFSRALNRISFEIRPQETVALVGESGSGKSITALTVMRLLPTPPGKVADGHVFFFEPTGIIDLLQLKESGMNRYRGRKIAMIFQEPMTSLNPVHRCGEQVTEAIRLHMGWPEKKAVQACQDLFREVRLPDPAGTFKKYPHQLSGGQKQRVMIAMALSCNPDILIADEPTTALDVTVQKSILELLHSLKQQRGMSILFITHDLGVAAEISDRVLVMHKGHIVEQGLTKTVFANPAHPYTRGLIACRPPMDRRPVRLAVIEDFTVSQEPSPETPAHLQSITPAARQAAHERLYSQRPILEVFNLHTTFPVRRNLWGHIKQSFKAVDDVTFNVFPGETLGLVGESGSGKTTLGRSILRLTDHTTGKVTFRDHSILDMERKELRKLRKEMQIIFQDPYSSLNPRMSIGESIMEPMRVHDLASDSKQLKEKALEWMEQVGLKGEMFNRFPHEFSGGQRQRVCVARALSLNPSLVICDESVSALDVSIQAQVLNLLNNLKSRFGLTYIFISHDLSVVRYMSDRIMVMKDGKIVETGEADQLCRNPATAYTRQLIGAIPHGII